VFYLVNILYYYRDTCEILRFTSDILRFTSEILRFTSEILRFYKWNKTSISPMFISLHKITITTSPQWKISLSVRQYKTKSLFKRLIINKRAKEEFEDTKWVPVIKIHQSKKDRHQQLPNEKGQTTIYKILNRKLKIKQH
jgi:hypothetical protein